MDPECLPKDLRNHRLAPGPTFISSSIMLHSELDRRITRRHTHGYSLPARGRTVLEREISGGCAWLTFWTSVAATRMQRRCVLGDYGWIGSGVRGYSDHPDYANWRYARRIKEADRQRRVNRRNPFVFGGVVTGENLAERGTQTAWPLTT